MHEPHECASQQEQQQQRRRRRRQRSQTRSYQRSETFAKNSTATWRIQRAFNGPNFHKLLVGDVLDLWSLPVVVVLILPRSNVVLHCIRKALQRR